MDWGDHAAVLAKINSNDSSVLRNAPEELKANPEFMLKAVKKNGRALMYASKDLQDYPVIVTNALKQDGSALEYASKNLQANLEIVTEAVKQDGWALMYASKDLQANPVIVTKAVKQNGWALYHASKDLQANTVIVTEAVKQGGDALQFASKDLRANPVIVTEAVKQNWEALMLASKDLRANPVIMTIAVNQYGDALGYASKALRNGGLKSYVESALSKFNTPMHVFKAFLRATRFSPVGLSAATSEAERACTKPSCVLQKLNHHGIHHATLFKLAIAEYAGVQGGEAFATLRGAAENCPDDEEFGDFEDSDDEDSEGVLFPASGDSAQSEQELIRVWKDHSDSCFTWQKRGTASHSL
jgi:hypothetical protein